MATFKIEYKTQGASGRQRLEGLTREDLIEIVQKQLDKSNRLPSRVWRLVNNQWRELTLTAFSDLFN